MAYSVSPVKVLFICTHNRARSQMAEGLLSSLGGDKVDVHSAGMVATKVKPEATQVMNELDVDIRHQYSKVLDRFVNQRFDFVVTVCDRANESCPIFPNADNRMHWSIEDPSSVEGSDEEILTEFRKARDELKRRIEDELLPYLTAAQ